MASLELAWPCVSFYGLVWPYLASFGLVWPFYGLVWPFYGLVWHFYGLKWHFLVFDGRTSSNLAVIDPNLFGLVFSGKDKEIKLIISL